MKPFNLEEYLANPSRKVVTRDGELARIICIDRPDDDLPIAALVTDKEGYSGVYFFFNNGQYVKNKPSGLDLFFASEKHEGWINVYRNSGSHTYAGAVYDSKEDAEKRKEFDENYVTTIKIEWEE